MNINPENCPIISNEICQQYCNADRSLCMEVSHPQVLFSALERISTELRQKNYRASHDALTGLWNKYKWEEMADERIMDAKKTNKDIGLLFIDLTNLKKVNDTLGHTAGDNLLADFAELMTSTLRESDIGRVGGDEFVILCDLSPHRDKTISPQERLASVTSRLREKTKTFFEVRTEFSNLGVTAAIGESLWSSSMSLEELIDQADVDMRAVKKIQHQQHDKYRS